MQENSILNFIGELINAGLREMFAGGSVEKIFLDEDTMKLSITARLDRYIEDSFIISAQNEIKSALGINKVVIEPRYPQNAFGENCAPQLVRAMKENVAAANGFLENAKFSFSENAVEISEAYSSITASASSRYKFFEIDSLKSILVTHLLR